MGRSPPWRGMRCGFLCGGTNWRSRMCFLGYILLLCLKWSVQLLEMDEHLFKVGTPFDCWESFKDALEQYSQIRHVQFAWGDSMERYPERCFHKIVPGQPKFDFNTSSISPLYETSYKNMIFYIKQMKIMSMPQWRIVLIFLAFWYPFPK